MRWRLLAIVVVVIALAVPRLPHQHHVLRKAAVASSASWGRHRRPPSWFRRHCAEQGCQSTSVLDSSGLCVLCAPSPHHPGHLVTLSLTDLTYTAAGLPMRKRHDHVPWAR